MPIHPGDRSPTVRRWREVMNLRFGPLYTRLHGPLPTDTDEYGPRAQAWQREYQRRTAQTPNGIVSDRDLQALGIAAPRPKPVVFTINGHLGGLFDGPAFFTARVLEDQGRVRVQPVGYDNVRKPFNNASGIAEINRLANDATVLPPGTPWAVLAHSQGSIVFCDWWEKVVEPNRNRWPYSGFQGGINFGNPRRPRGSVAPWVADPPPTGSEGLDPDCLDAPIPGVAEVSRDGDLYANKTPGAAAEYKEAVYLAVARGQFTGRNSLLEQIGELATRLGAEVIPLFQAIVSGVVGLANLREHGEFDLRPCIDHTARILGV